MRITAVASAVLLPVAAVAQDGLPWPAVAAEQLYLPFGLEWFQEGSREKVAGLGEPECTPEMCRWMADRREGTVILTQTYHGGTLVGLRLDYALTREAGLRYRARIRELEERLGEDWVVLHPGDPLLGLMAPGEAFQAESRNTRIRATCREGEHAVWVSLDMEAR